MIRNINFVSKFKKANFISIIIFVLSIILISFKGLNYGIDFKGGTLIELRTKTSIDTYLISDCHSLQLLYGIDQHNLFFRKYLTLAGGILFQKFFS